MASIGRLPELLTIRAQATPGNVAHDDTSRALTFAEWESESASAAGGLRSSGVAVGDRVLLPITNRHAVDMAVMFLAVQRCGAIAVPLNTRLSADETDYFATLTGARWAITDIGDRLSELDLQQAWSVEGVPRDPSVVIDQASLDPDGDADIISTSGTTGRPKGVVFSHRSLLSKMSFGEASSSSKVLLHALPFTGFGGCHGLMLASLRFGSTVITQPSFSAAGMLELIEEKQPDTLHLVPSMLQLILDDPDVAAADTSSVRWIITGTAPLPNDTVTKLNSLWPRIRIVNVYGMTESEVNVTTRTRSSVSKPGSVGQPDDRAKVQIRDEVGDTVPDGVDGEVWTRSSNPLRYWGDDSATSSTWVDGWLKTGDVGHIDEDGDLILTGRSKDLIIRGGYNIGPGEVEDTLLGHPDVREAAVVGVPHPVLGEDVAAAVVLRDGSGATVEDLLDHAKRALADNKVPRTIVIKDALPYNQNMKVVKRDLVAELAAQAAIDRERRSDR